MANALAQERPTGFHSLPSEIRHHIFEYIYTPWHFEYTQVHDTATTRGFEFLRLFVVDIAGEYTSTPRFSNLPSIAPLLVCKDFHHAGRHIFDSSFTGHIHVISRMMWKEVHWTYASVMAKATTLTVLSSDLKTLFQCRVMNRLENLKNIILVWAWYSSTNGSVGDFWCQIRKTEAPQIPDSMPLEGSELARFLPTDIDLSDTHLLDFPWKHVHRMQMDNEIRSTLRSMELEVTCRAVIGVPVLPEHMDQGIQIFLILDFSKEQGNGLQESISEDENEDSYILVRKRLAMFKEEVS